VPKSRLEQREDLLIQISMAASPIRSVFDDPDRAKKAPYVRAQFMSDLAKLNPVVTAYCTIEGRQFGVELDRIHRALKHLKSCLTPENIIDLNTKTLFDLLLAEVVKEVRAVPCDPPSAILPGESPFQTYCHIRSIVSVAGSRIELFDPYLGADVFHMYLRDLPTNVFVRIVTSDKIMQPARAKDERRRNEIVAISKLAAAETSIRYRFYVSAQQHDRHLRVDNDILHLGGSVKDAGRFDPYTISTLDPSQSNHAVLDQIIAGADEWFGPNVSKHREK
jgi:hypothetical protein